MDGRLFDEFLASTVLGGLTVALGCAFQLIQERTKATVGLAITWISTGLAVITIPVLVDTVDADQVTLWERLQVVFQAGTVAGLCVYVSGVLATTQSSARGGSVVQLLVRVGYVEAGLFALVGFAFPAPLANDYLLNLGAPGVLERPGFWLWAVFYVLIGLTFGLAWAVLARQGLDPGERARAVCYVLSTPFLVVATALPYTQAVVSFTISYMLLLLGMFRHAADQGEREAFLSRFLSPQVSEMVRLEGLASVMQPREVDLTVVCCDLRGFTAYAEAVPSQAVIDLLGEYYDTVGDVVAEVDGTIKDFAGDGILVLVGAPLTRPDHAAAGLLLASLMLEVGHRVTRHWATGPHPLGIGVGVASGRVTVGGVGSTGRSEYTAVGAPVNLAARLCSAARDGEILVDQRTAEQAGTNGLEPRGAMQLKGLSHAVAVFAVPGSGGV